jgi:hypothetical protein
VRRRRRRRRLQRRIRMRRRSRLGALAGAMTCSRTFGSRADAGSEIGQTWIAGRWTKSLGLERDFVTRTFIQQNSTRYLIPRLLSPRKMDTYTSPNPNAHTIPERRAQNVCVYNTTFIVHYPPFSLLKYQMPHPVNKHNPRNQHARQLQYRNFIPRLRHARQAARAAFERAAECGEGFALHCMLR